MSRRNDVNRIIQGRAMPLREIERVSAELAEAQNHYLELIANQADGVWTVTSQELSDASRGIQKLEHELQEMTNECE